MKQVPDHRWKLIEQAIFTEPPAGASGHLRIYCDAACVAIIPIADSSQEAMDRAIQLGQHIADAVNGSFEVKRSDSPVLTWGELDLIQQGLRIDAIKALRSRLGCGLREAIDLIKSAEKMSDALSGGNP